MVHKAKWLMSLLLALSMAFALTANVCAATATPYHNWKQYDAQWAGEVLTCKKMKEVGCLVTSVAMLAVQAGLKSEKGFDPGILVADLRKISGFTADDDLIWEKVPLVIAGFTAETPWADLKGTQSEKAAKLRSWLNQGYSVAVAVKNESHWVALRGITGGVVTMMDPGSMATNLFEKYAAAGVTRAALFRAEKKPAVQDSTEPPAGQTTRPPISKPQEKPSLLGLLDDWCNQDMAKSVFAFFGAVANLLWKCMEWVLASVKLR